MKIGIVGAGGFAREVAWLIKDIGRERAMLHTTEPLSVAGFLVSDPSQRGNKDSEALGDFSWLKQNRIDGLAMGIGNPTVRLKLAAELQAEFPDLKWPALIHPSVTYDSSSCTFAEGVIICAGNILTVNVRVERFAMINLSCTVGHETSIGEGTVINPLCAISGGVKIGKRCLIGTHSAILQDLCIGDGAVVASGAMVHRSVPAGVTVMGVPAKSKEILKTIGSDGCQR
jgi:sugar O-acyltransferase (sialic acid O-acetyltransferase NeuD family)